jgi:hypothetical protein
MRVSVSPILFKGGVMLHDDKFMELIGVIQRYKDANKDFVVNDIRMAEVKKAITVAEKLFVDMSISVKPDALQLGNTVICIEGFDIVVRGKEEIDLFTELISRADNFEIYAGNESVKFSIMFNGVYTVNVKN